VGRVQSIPATDREQPCENVQLADGAKLASDLSETSREFPPGRVVDVEKWEQFMQSPRGDARLVERFDAAVPRTDEGSPETLHTFLK
jgi:hypothetical protein